MIYVIGIVDYDKYDNAIAELFVKDPQKKKLNYLGEGIYNFEKDVFYLTKLKGKISKEKITLIKECLSKHDWDNCIIPVLKDKIRNQIFKKFNK